MPPDRLLSVEEYLALELASAVRHEYVDGEVFAMSGVSRRHSRIVGNIFARLWTAARGGPCRVHQEAVKLRVGQRVYHPDVMVACGAEPENEYVEDAPCLVVEVTSPSTEQTDRREKMFAYRTIPSLGAYLVVDQDRRRVDRYWRGAKGWERETLRNDGAITLPCPDLTLTLDEIYEGVELPAAEATRVREEEAAYQ